MAESTGDGAPHEGPKTIDELRARTLQIFSRLLAYVATPLLAFIHVTLAFRGQYTTTLAVQAAAHLVACTGFFATRRGGVRVAVLLSYLVVTEIIILLHYGPTITTGFIAFIAILISQVYFDWRGVVAIGVAIVLCLSFGWYHFVVLGGPIFVPALSALDQTNTWVRLTVTAITVVGAAGALLVSFQKGLQQAVEEAQVALGRERAARAEMERIAEARAKFERALADAQRQELVGRIAAGAAHDLNNVLTAIMAGAELTELDLDEGNDEATRKGLREILEAARRGSAMGRQLLSFSKQQPTQPRLVGLDELFPSVQTLLARLLPSNVKLTMDVNGGLPPVFVDPAQLEQVVMNLVLNARDAMPHGGEIRVVVGPESGPEGRTGAHIAVSDEGSGIPEVVRGKIFDPFFTTKEGGVGTGLGLATVRAIAEQYDGTVGVDSEMGRGTTFHFWLPAASAQQLSSEQEGSATTTTLARRGSERVLVADDDAEIRRVAEKILRSGGYEVVTAEDGHETIERVRDAHFDIVILDAVMPGPSGAKLVAELEALRPELGMLFSTGYDPGVFGAAFFADGSRKLLSKPYRRKDLLAAVRQVLDQRRERQSNATARRDDHPSPKPPSAKNDH
jgi:signal transduction histidine kinase/ActR/RegA family two-component response regulator